MRVGIVSDSHGREKTLAAALEVLSAENVRAIVHCGDIGSQACLAQLGGFEGDSYAVAGNTDRHIAELSALAAEAGVAFHPVVVEVPIDVGRYLAATHGHNEHVLAELIAGKEFPYVCHGHTHRARDERVGSVRVICPGALRHPREPHYPTVAVLDTAEDSLVLLRAHNE
ncbi:MAG: metallophosphoesterase family protein [Planctomycetes bacterium]|nr:metallophosphoesterase family protein [Planctomycetota bacterium]